MLPGSWTHNIGVASAMIYQLNCKKLRQFLSTDLDTFHHVKVQMLLPSRHLSLLNQETVDIFHCYDSWHHPLWLAFCLCVKYGQGKLRWMFLSDEFLCQMSWFHTKQHTKHSEHFSLCALGRYGEKVIMKGKAFLMISMFSPHPRAINPVWEISTAAI